MAVLDAVEYRTDILIFVLSGVAQPIILMSIWLGIAAASKSAPMSHDGFVQYYMAYLVVNLWVNAWHSIFIIPKIRLGDLSPYLLHPIHYFTVIFGENIGEKIFKTTVVIPIVVVIFSIFRPDIPNVSWFQISIFAFSLALSIAITFIVGVFLPFRYTLSFPIEVLLGQVSGQNIAIGLTMQILWLTAFFILVNTLWSCGLKRYSASGA